MSAKKSESQLQRRREFLNRTRCFSWAKPTAACLGGTQNVTHSRPINSPSRGFRQLNSSPRAKDVALLDAKRHALSIGQGVNVGCVQSVFPVTMYQCQLRTLFLRGSQNRRVWAQNV